LEDEIDLLPISAVTGEGVEELVQRVFRMLGDTPQASSAAPTARRVYRIRPEEGYRVEAIGDGFAVRGAEVERLVRKLVLDSRDAQEYLAERLEKMGVLSALRGKGLETGQTVRIGGVELEFDG
jgi:GTP-binding protein